MNQRILSFLLVISALLLLLFMTACHKDPETGSDVDSADSSEQGESDSEALLWEQDARVSFVPTPGIRFLCDTRSGETLPCGSRLVFTVEQSAFYTGKPEVTANGKSLSAGEDGSYSLLLSGDTRIEVKGIRLPEHSITGSGSSAEDPFVLSTPVDLLYMAEQVNAGNSSYVGAFYQLEADLDFGGESLPVIGDGLLETAYFEGYFDGQGHTISNYVQYADGLPYAGLFGILQVNLQNSVGGTVYRLNLKDYTVRALAAEQTLFCGSVAGYAVGANLILCNAEEGRIEIFGDVNQFTYVGGLIGFQQGYDDGTRSYLSSAAYCNVGVEIDCVEGAVYSAGGICGYLSASAGNASATINNCISTGNVRGAMLSGGIAGYIGEATGIVNCYTTGVISAQSSSVDTDNAERFCHTYAGGIAGLAEPDSVIAESFAAGKVYAKAALGERYAHAGGILGKAAAIEDGKYAAAPATVYRCVSVADGEKDFEKKLTDASYLQNTLGWNSCDWVFSENAYPKINTEEHDEYCFDITLRFPGSPDLTVSDFSVYMPMRFWYLEDVLPASLTGEAGDPRTSYGYFFDEEYTLPIPDSYLPTHEMTVYVATADYSEVAGEYVLLTGGTGESVSTLTLFTDGSFRYTDGAVERESRYLYDGKRVILRNARLSRYSILPEGMDAFGFADFSATVQGDRMEIVGGVLSEASSDPSDQTAKTLVAFPEGKPLVALRADSVMTGRYCGEDGIYSFFADGSGTVEQGSRVEDFRYSRDGSRFTLTRDGASLSGSIRDGAISLNGSALTACDAFAGNWAVDAKAMKVFGFDGNGKWSYTYYGYRRDAAGVRKIVLDSRCGDYTVKNGVLHMTGEWSGSAQFAEDLLRIQVDADDGSISFRCHRDGSYCGSWVYPAYGITLRLDGIAPNGEGTGRLEYCYPDETVEFYAIRYSFDPLREGLLCLYYGEEVLGSLRYLPENDTLDATMYVGTQGSFMKNVPLYRVDELKGDWIGDREDLPLLSFNGFGAYQKEMLSGSVTVGEAQLPYTLEDATLSGSFLFGGVLYRMRYDEANETLTVTAKGSETTYVRKDRFAALTLRDENGADYRFDGRGELSSLGSLTVTDANGKETRYRYRVVAGEAILLEGTQEIGRLTAGEKTYQLTLRSQNSIALRIVSEYTGVWAMSGSMENLVIGEMELDGRMSGKINGQATDFYPEEDHLTFRYGENSFYILRVGKSNLVISQSVAWYQTNDPIYCAPVDVLFGHWENSLGAGYTFDGMANSTLTNGSAQSGLSENAISFFYQWDEDGYFVLWTELGGETQLYRVDFCDPDTRRAFVHSDGERAFTVTEGDRLYDSSFRDVAGETDYIFDGFGGGKTDTGEAFTYTLTSLDLYTGIAMVELTFTKDGKTQSAKLDFSTADRYTLTFLTE